jgi:hypothetical protein
MLPTTGSARSASADARDSSPPCATRCRKAEPGSPQSVAVHLLPEAQETRARRPCQPQLCPPCAATGRSRLNPSRSHRDQHRQSNGRTSSNVDWTGYGSRRSDSQEVGVARS